MMSGRRVRTPWPRLRRALKLRSAVHRVVAAATALTVCAAVSAVAIVVATSKGSPGAPVQQVWGSAAGRSHRVPASATMAKVAGGRVVPVAVSAPRSRRAVAAEIVADEAKAALPASRRPKGAVAPSAPSPRLRLPARGKLRPEQLGVLRAPQAAAKPGFNPKTSRLVPSQTSANQQVFQNADGTRTAMEYQMPRYYKRADGSWAGIDTTLVPAGRGSGGWQVKAVAEQESFAPFADAGTLVRLSVSGSQALGFGIAGAGHAAGVVSGSTVTYAGVLPDSDVRYIAGAGLVTEQVVLRSRNAPTTWVFPLSLSGLRAVQHPDGPIEFTDSAASPVAVVEPGYMTDSNINPRSGDGAYSDGVSYTLVTLDGHPAIRMTLDTTWLDSSARVFPVTVDPSVSDVNSNGTTYVESPGSADYSSDNEIDVGTYNGGTNVAKSFLKFDNVSSTLQNDYVLGARLAVFNSWSYSCSPRPVSVYPVTASWSVSGAKSYPGPSTGPALASKSFATGWVPLGEAQSQSQCPNQWEGFNLGTAGNTLVNGWTHGTIANNGLAQIGRASCRERV